MSSVISGNFDQGLADSGDMTQSFVAQMMPLYEQYQALQNNQLNKISNGANPASNIAYPDLSALMAKVNEYYDSYAKQASDYATQRYQNTTSLMADEFAKKAQRQGLGNQGTLGTTGPESAWRQEYAKKANEGINTNYSNIASQAALGKAGFASGSALTDLYNQVYKQNMSNSYNNNLWKMQLANQYANSSNPFTSLASIGASLYRGYGDGADSVSGMSGYGGSGGGTSSNVNSGAGQVASDYGFPGTYERATTYQYFPSLADSKYGQTAQ